MACYGGCPSRAVAKKCLISPGFRGFFVAIGGLVWEHRRRTFVRQYCDIARAAEGPPRARWSGSPSLTVTRGGAWPPQGRLPRFRRSLPTDRNGGADEGPRMTPQNDASGRPNPRAHRSGESRGRAPRCVIRNGGTSRPSAAGTGRLASLARVVLVNRLLFTTEFGFGRRAL
jgi:hypothetical protein